MGIAHSQGICFTYAMPNSQLLTAKEKAAELGIHRSTLSRRVKSGLIVPAYQDTDNRHNGVQLFDPERANVKEYRA